MVYNVRAPHRLPVTWLELSVTLEVVRVSLFSARMSFLSDVSLFSQEARR